MTRAAARRLRPGAVTPAVAALLLAGFVAASSGQGFRASAQGSQPTPYERVWSRKDPGLNRSSSPIIADIDGDGGNEIVVGHRDGMLRAYEANGLLKWRARAVPEFGPDTQCNAQSAPSAIESSPAVADIDGDGDAEVVVGVGSVDASGQNGSLISFDGATGRIEWVFDHNRDIGDPLQGQSTALDGWCEAVYSTPAIGDVDGDGDADAVFGGFDFRVWAVDGEGRPLPGFPFDTGGSVWSSPALFNVDGDNDVEIFIGGDSTLLDGSSRLGGVFWALDHRDGEVVPLWHRLANEIFHSSPAVADIDGDGRFEAVVGMGRKWHERCGGDRRCPDRNAGSQHMQVWAFRLDDGTDLPGWPVTTTGSVQASPAVGDVDADGHPEVVLGSHDGVLYVWNGNGTIQWSAEPRFPHPELGSGRITGHPIIADLDGDGDQDIAVGLEIGIAFLDGRDGSSLDGSLAWQDLMGFGISYETAPAVGQFGDSRLIVAAGFDESEDSTLTSVYKLPPTVAKDAWPMFGYDAARQGTASTSPDGHGVAERYADIADAGVHRVGIEALSKAGFLTRTECRQGFFCPDRPVERWVMAVWLVRILDDSEPLQGSGPASGFTDVEAGRWWAPYVSRLAELGVTKGCAKERYCPEDSVTRGQMATFLTRALDLRSAASSPAGFTDIADSVHAPNIEALAAAGITGGCTIAPLRFCPGRSTSRGQMSTFLARALNLIELPTS